MTNRKSLNFLKKHPFLSSSLTKLDAAKYEKKNKFIKKSSLQDKIENKKPQNKLYLTKNQPLKLNIAKNQLEEIPEHGGALKIQQLKAEKKLLMEKLRNKDTEHDDSTSSSSSYHKYVTDDKEDIPLQRSFSSLKKSNSSASSEDEAIPYNKDIINNDGEELPLSSSRGEPNTETLSDPRFQDEESENNSSSDSFLKQQRAVQIKREEREAKLDALRQKKLMLLGNLKNMDETQDDKGGSTEDNQNQESEFSSSESYAIRDEDDINQQVITGGEDMILEVDEDENLGPGIIIKSVHSSENSSENNKGDQMVSWSSSENEEEEDIKPKYFSKDPNLEPKPDEIIQENEPIVNPDEVKQAKLKKLEMLRKKKLALLNNLANEQEEEIGSESIKENDKSSSEEEKVEEVILTKQQKLKRLRELKARNLALLNKQEGEESDVKNQNDESNDDSNSDSDNGFNKHSSSSENDSMSSFSKKNINRNMKGLDDSDSSEANRDLSSG